MNLFLQLLIVSLSRACKRTCICFNQSIRQHFLMRFKKLHVISTVIIRLVFISVVILWSRNRCFGFANGASRSEKLSEREILFFSRSYRSYLHAANAAIVIVIVFAETTCNRDIPEKTSSRSPGVLPFRLPAAGGFVVSPRGIPVPPLVRPAYLSCPPLARHNTPAFSLSAPCPWWSTCSFAFFLVKSSNGRDDGDNVERDGFGIVRERKIDYLCFFPKPVRNISKYYIDEENLVVYVLYI